MIKFFYKNKKIIVAIIIIIAIFLSGSNNVLAATTGEAAIGLGNYFLGGIGYAISLVLSLIAYILTAVIGLLITVVVAVLIQVAQYGNIINVPTVIEGWVIIRDLCNMLFILILLIVAFATILRIESYQWKKILPKLLIMAVLINFSRTIFGLLIDFSQVIMLTFVNAFSAGGGYFIDAFRANRFFSVKGATSGDFAVDTWSTAISIIAGVLAAIITLIVVSVMLAVLVMRIVMLWIYTIFSPLIFLGFAVPAIQKYTGKIWEDFTKQLVVGPVLAFFIWLALTTASKSTDLLMEQNLTSTEVCVGAGAFFCQGNFQQFIIVIGLLMGGLMVAQEMGGAAGSIAGKGLDWAKKSALAPIAGAGKGVKALAAFGADKIQHSGIMDLNIVRAWTKLQESRKDKKSRMYAEGQDAAAARMARSGGVFSGLLAATATPGGAWEDISTGFSLRHPFSSKGIKQRRMGGKGMAAKREELLPGLQQAEFEASFSKLDKVEQEKELEKNSFESLRLTNAIKSEKDEEKKKKLINR